MCGFSGFLDCSGYLPSTEWASILECMASALKHRGPDDSGVWLETKGGIGLSHRRLAVLDLSPTGHQPMVSFSKRYVIAFNGEIYNHFDLRKQMGAQPWRGRSDTETLLAGFEAWGIEQTLKYTVGMFAFALWDRQNQILTLARDRMGEKPIYYGWQQGVFLFGSELKALRQHPAFENKLNRDAVALYLRYSYVPTPQSIYQGINKLLPGTLLHIAGDEHKQPMPVSYWSLKEIIEQSQKNRFQGSDEEAISEFEARLSEAICLQQISDVPLGAFLSGGIDSSTVVALMQKKAHKPVRTFTIGFEESNYNEAHNAKAVAKHLETDHTELYITASEARSVVPRLPSIYDEPFSDSSQIPTFLISKLSREHVTVSLSGDAGDELFGGYNRYMWATKILRYPRIFRNLFAKSLTTLSPSTWDHLYAALAFVVPNQMRFATPGDKAYKLASILTSEQLVDIYQRLISSWTESEICMWKVSDQPQTQLNGFGFQSGAFEQQMMATDAVTYLPDDILVKVDRAAMAVSLETRVPFLDHRLVEFSWRLPLSMKIRQGQGKWILRQLLYKYVPKHLVSRPKAGFAVPIDRWLRGPLRQWASALLDEWKLKKQGFLNSALIQQKWEEHLSLRRNWQHQLWNVLMLQSWLEENKVA